MALGGVNYGLSIIHAGNRARVQANAPCLFRCCNSISARSWSGMTFLPIANACACRRNTAFRNRRRCFSPHVSRYAPTNISIASNSTVTRGISSGRDGGSPSIDTSPNATRTPRCNYIGTRNGYSRNRRNQTFMVNNQRPALPPAECAVGRADWVIPFPASRSAAPSPHSRTAGLKPAASLFPIVRGQPSQGCRRISVLRQRRPFAAVSASQVFVARDPNPPLKANFDHVAHLTSRQVVPAQRRSVEEQQ